MIRGPAAAMPCFVAGGIDKVLPRAGADHGEVCIVGTGTETALHVHIR